MTRPPVLVCDTDALIQFLLVGEVRPLRLIRSSYSIQPVVVPEVEIELRSRKFGLRIAGELNKALSNGLLRMLDKPFLEAHYGGSPGGALAATAALGQIAKTGSQYAMHVDRGEAFTHAAAVILNAAAMSNDKNALDVLVTAGLPVPGTVLRAFDLLAFSYQVGSVSEVDCDTFRKDLVAEGEGIPRAFKQKSFLVGLKDFAVRIIDTKKPPVGRQLPDSFPYATPISL